MKMKNVVGTGKGWGVWPKAWGGIYIYIYIYIYIRGSGHGRVFTASTYKRCRPVHIPPPIHMPS